ncbi:MAG: acyl-CoA thioesterase [Verrucomicrobiales bacterium]|nr:acyl-CoA thioesterase [Verrucomicrobiales bacterium]
MENRRLVLPEHLNHFGFLFGGQLLRWVDETAWIAATRDFPGCRLLTVALDEVVFRKSVQQGTVLRLETQRSKTGRTSVTYEVQVFAESIETGAEDPVFTTQVTLVRVAETGQKLPLPLT